MFDNISLKGFQSLLLNGRPLSGNERPDNKPEDIIKNESTNSISLEEDINFKILKYYYSLKKDKENREKEKEEELIEEPCQIKQEAGIKYCVVKLLKFIRNIINAFIINSSIKKRQKKTIFRPNSKLFTAKITESASSSSLHYSVLEIFSKGKDDNKNKKQKQNFDNINNILKEIEEHESKNKKLEENIKMLKIILQMKYLNLINLFLESKDFENFINDPKTILFNKEILRQNQPSICDKKGFFFHFNLPRKKKNKYKFKIERNTDNKNKNFFINQNCKEHKKTIN